MPPREQLLEGYAEQVPSRHRVGFTKLIRATEGTLKKRIALCLVIAAVLVACAVPPAPSVGPTRWRTVLVTALGTAVPGTVEVVSDKFTFDGRIHAHATLIAETSVIPSNPTLTFKWFNAGKLVHERSGQQPIASSPYYLVHALPGSVVGVGTARVELYLDGRLIASRDFTVSER